MLKKFISLLIVLNSVFFFFGAEKKLSVYEERTLISNLNYLQYSISKIKGSDNKAIAEDEYYSIINEISMNSINNDELKEQYELFLMSCSTLKLNQNEKNFLREMNMKERKNAWKGAFSSVGSVFVPGRTPLQTALSLVYTTTANILNVENKKNELNTQLEKDLFYLNQSSLGTIYEMQTNLFATCMDLLGGKDIEGRVLEDSMNVFVTVKNIPDINERLCLLEEENFKKNLEKFPPYWFELGNAYQISGKNDKAIDAYDEFEKLKKYDVIEKDRTYVKLLKNKIMIYLSENDKNGNLRNKKKILKCIDLINKNVLDTDAGAKNSFLANVYFLIGETDKALSCLNYILSTQSVNSEYLFDAVNLRQIIISSAEKDFIDVTNNNTTITEAERNLYKNVYAYKNIKIGNSSLLFKELYGDYKPDNFFEKSKDFVVDKFTSLADKFSKKISGSVEISEDKETEEKTFLDNRYIFFSIPKDILVDSTFSIINNGATYEAKVIGDNENEILYYIEKPLEEEKDFYLVFHFIRKDNTELQVKYSVNFIDNKYYENANKAFERIGSDINSYNAEFAALYGKELTENDFTYKVKDVEKLRKDIRKRVERDNKKLDVPLTYTEMENTVKESLSQQLQVDINNLQTFFAKVYREYYAKNAVLYNSYFTSLYGDDYYFGLESIYDMGKNSRIYFDSIGNCHTVTE